MMLRGLFLLLLFISLPAWAITHPDERLPDPAQESRALALTKNLRCVVCQNESIEESRADMARDLRILVRQQIKDGKTDAQITEFLHSKYGDFIFLKPPVTPRTYILWAMPLLIVVGGIILFASSLRLRRRRR